MREKYEVEAKWIKEGYKRGPLSLRRTIQGKNPQTKKKHQNAVFEKWQNSGARDHHRLPVVFTTARGGGWHGRVAWDARPCVPYCHRLLQFRLCPFVFLRDFSDFCHLKDNVSRHIGNRIPPHSIHHSPSSVVLD